MEFVISTNLEQAFPSSIDFNFEELKGSLTNDLKAYTGLVVTEDNISVAKAKRANLRKLREAIEARRKEVKKLCNAPYADFETKIKQITALIDEPIQAIDSQLTVFEVARVKSKTQEIHAIYEKCAGDMADVISLQQIWSDKWTNVTVSLEKTEEDMTALFSKAGNDIAVLKAMKLDCENAVLLAYCNSLDMGVALAEKHKYEQEQEKLKALAKAQKETTQPASEPAPVAKTTPANTTPVQVAEQGKTIKVIFYDTTAAFREEMRALTQKHNITYGGIQ